MPVLTEEAIEAAASIKHGEVCVSCLGASLICEFGVARSRASGAKPPCNAVGRQGVVVPFKDSLLWGSSPPSQPTVNIEDQTAKTPFAGTDFAVVGAHATGNSVRSPGWFWGEAEPFSAFGVNAVRQLKRLFRPLSNAW